MKPRRTLWLLVSIALFFAVSLYISAKKRQSANFHDQVVVIDGPTPGPSATPPQILAASATPVAGLPQNAKAQTAPDAGVLDESKSCSIQPEFQKLKEDLGHLVNNGDARANEPQFLAAVNAFRLAHGLPLPIGIAANKLSKFGAVYNNCKADCRGSVHTVFVSQILEARSIEVATQDGTLKKVPLHDSGLEVASIDELNKSGVPFRSWLAPVSSSDYYIKNNDLYYSLDIEGLWLKISPDSHWQVVLIDRETLSKLSPSEDLTKIAGCSAQERCLESKTDNTARHFKAPKLCND